MRTWVTLAVVAAAITAAAILATAHFGPGDAAAPAVAAEPATTTTAAPASVDDAADGARDTAEVPETDAASGPSVRTEAPTSGTPEIRAAEGDMTWESRGETDDRHPCLISRKQMKEADREFVKETQRWAEVKDDGIWGPQSEAARDAKCDRLEALPPAQFRVEGGHRAGYGNFIIEVVDADPELTYQWRASPISSVDAPLEKAAVRELEANPVRVVSAAHAAVIRTFQVQVRPCTPEGCSPSWGEHQAAKTSVSPQYKKKKQTVSEAKKRRAASTTTTTPSSGLPEGLADAIYDAAYCWGAQTQADTEVAKLKAQGVSHEDATYIVLSFLASSGCL